MVSVSAGHIILTPTQPVGSGRPQRESNPGPPHQESRALPTKLPHPPLKGRERLGEREKETETERDRKKEEKRERQREEETEIDRDRDRDRGRERKGRVKLTKTAT